MKKTLCFIIALMYTGTAFAGEIEAVSEISDVTVFPDRADVSRIARLSVPAGKHTIVFNSLPAGLITDSLRVAGKDPPDLRSVP